MANEPERPIEKLLRATAKKRRDKAGVPLELHPATRRLLQGEVARKFARPRRETRSFSEVLGQLWPRFALGVTIFAVLAVAMYLLLPVPGKGKPEARLAKNEPMPLAVPAKQALPPPSTEVATVPALPAAALESNPAAVEFADSATPARAQPARQLGVERQPLSKDGLAAQTDREATKKLAAAAAPQLGARKKTVEAEIVASGGPAAQAPAEIANEAFRRRYSLATKPAPPASTPVAPASPPPVTTTTAAFSAVAADESTKLTGDKADQPALAYKSLGAVASASRLKSSPAATESLLKSVGENRRDARSVGVVQRFTQVAPGPNTKERLADKVMAPPSVLASFQVEQAGPELRIVDGDGSVYSGYLQIGDATGRQRSAQAEASAGGRAAGAPGGLLEQKPAARLDADQRVPQTYFFRVAGTNRSLNQAVVFTGNLLAATNLTSFLPPTNALRIGSGVAGGRTGSSQPNLLPLRNSLISGKVVVGNGQAIEINALPTNP